MYRVCSVDFSIDNTLMAAGFSDSMVRVYSLTGKPLVELRTDDIDTSEIDSWSNRSHRILYNNLLTVHSAFSVRGPLQ